MTFIDKKYLKKFHSAKNLLPFSMDLNPDPDLDPQLDPDLHSSKRLDPDPHIMYSDPKHWHRVLVLERDSLTRFWYPFFDFIG
jgi:hypothetical protein